MTDFEINKQTAQYYWRHAKRYPILLWGMITTLPLAVLVHQFLPALITANILDRLSSGDFVSNDVWGSFGNDILAIIGLSILGGVIIWRINIYFNWKLEANVVRDIDREVFDHLMKLSSTFHSNNFGGSLVSQHKKLAGAYTRLTDTTMFQLGGLISSILFTAILLWTRATLYVILLLIFCIFYISLALIATKTVRERSRKEADAGNDLTGQVADSVTNVMAVKSYAAAESENERFGKVTDNWHDKMISLMWANIKVQYLFSSTGVVINAMAVILAVASVVSFGADIATVFLVFTYTMTVRERLWHFSGQALRNYNRAFGDAQAMIKILSISPSVKDPETPEEPRINKGAIKIEDMSFNHPESNEDNILFEHFDLVVDASEKIGLVGHSGSGKTTLAKLLLRFNDIDGGKILIDGQNIADIKQHDLRIKIAYVPQEPMLFHRSIRENIAFGKQDATEKEIMRAAKKANALEFIKALPHGFNTLVGERGVKLSGGQRQRVAIARAILKDAPVLLLDEATSALDSESEKLIQEALWDLMKDRTAIVVAHRLSTIQKMDRIVVMDEGRIIEQGTHKQLLKTKGTYAKLWEHQSGGFLEE